MADVPVSGLVLRRQANHFINDSGDRVDYFDALVFDPVARDLVLVRAGKREGLAEFEPGVTLTGVPVEVLGQHKITVTKVRPSGVVGANVPENY